MEDFYPVMMKLQGKKVVIVGGGNIALRKAKGLAGTGAEIKIVSPAIHEELKQLPFIHWHQKEFAAEDIKDAHIIFAATSSKAVNEYVCQCAHEFQWVNDTSERENSSFINPAVVRGEKLVLTVSTSGASPVLAKKIKQDLEQKYGEYDKLVKRYGGRRLKSERNN